MKVPYDVRWLPTSEPATALLVPGRRAEDLLRVCVELGVAAWPSVFATADGFLLLLDVPTEMRLTGVIRLRGLAKHLLIPVNGDLIPPLLADEASALVSKRGLVFLPEGRVLEFDPANPIPASLVIQLEPPQWHDWRALPTAPTLAETITEITLFETDPSPDFILEQGGAGIGEETPKLPDSGLAKQMLSNALFKLGKGLASLGQSMGMSGVAGMGAKMLGAAMNMMPALSEKMMGAQEAILRELLRQFRAGNIEEALKHAMPLNNDPSRGMRPAQTAQLPTHDLFYSLRKLLGPAGGGGAASLWFSSDDTFRELMREYQKQADLAVRAGDFRRAAFIYARLLNDFFNAAKVLAQGGLHRDAAIIYEKKLNDLHQAAREWEAAGEFDRAIGLYHQLGDHVMAGDLLRRLGEEERAIAEYQIAAAKLVENGSRCYDAGELLRVKAQRPDLAMEYYTQGWQRRPAGDSLSCATRLVQAHAEDSKPAPFADVLTEAEEFLMDGDAVSSATFFTEVARLAKTKGLTPIADEVHDLALLGIARKLRQSQANLLKDPAVWPTPLIGDAQFALAHAPRSVAAKSDFMRVKAGESKVTAVCQMAASGEVFLGFENGEVALFDPQRNEARRLTHEGGPILSLAIQPVHKYLTVLSQTSPSEVRLRVYRFDIGIRKVDYIALNLNGPARLAPAAINCNADFIVLHTGEGLRVFQLPNLLCLSVGPELEKQFEPAEAVIYGTRDGSFATMWMIVFDLCDAVILTPDLPNRTQVLYNLATFGNFGWSPTAQQNAGLQTSPHIVQMDDSTVEVTALSGAVDQILIDLHNRKVTRLPRQGGHSYRAFACLRSGLTAGIHRNGVDWWTQARAGMKHTKLTLDNPVAAFPLADSRELLIVEEDGTLMRLPIVD